MRKSIYRNTLSLIYEIEYIDIIRNFFSNTDFKNKFSEVSNKMVLLFNKQNDLIMKNIPSTLLHTKESKASSVEFLNMIRRYIQDGELYKPKSVNYSIELQKLFSVREIGGLSISNDDFIKAADYAYSSKFDIVSKVTNLSEEQIKLVEKYTPQLIEFKLGRLGSELKSLSDLAITLNKDYGISKEKINSFLLNLLEKHQSEIVNNGRINIRSVDLVESITLFKQEILNNNYSNNLESVNTNIAKLETSLQNKEETISNLNSKIEKLQDTVSDNSSKLLETMQKKATSDLIKIAKSLGLTKDLESAIHKMRIDNVSEEKIREFIYDQMETLKTTLAQTKTITVEKIREIQVPVEYKSGFDSFKEFFSGYRWGLIVVGVFALLLLFYSFIRKGNELVVVKTNYKGNKDVKK
jgi:hypothetical protein